MTLDQRLILLDRLGTEMCEQVTLRRTQVKGRLERWLYFEEQCRRLMENIAKCESAVVAYNDLPIDDVIVLLQTVSGFMFHCLWMKSRWLDTVAIFYVSVESSRFSAFLFFVWFDGNLLRLQS